MTFVDHGSKQGHLTPITQKTAQNCARGLLRIFGVQGAPCIWQSDNGGREFVNDIIKEVAAMWPGCKIVHGRARHSQSQGGVERFNRTMEEAIHKALEEVRNNNGHVDVEWDDEMITAPVLFGYHSNTHRTIYIPPYKKSSFRDWPQRKSLRTS